MSAFSSKYYRVISVDLDVDRSQFAESFPIDAERLSINKLDAGLDVTLGLGEGQPGAEGFLSIDEGDTFNISDLKQFWVKNKSHENKRMEVIVSGREFEKLTPPRRVKIDIPPEFLGAIAKAGAGDMGLIGGGTAGNITYADYFNAQWYWQNPPNNPSNSPGRYQYGGMTARGTGGSVLLRVRPFDIVVVENFNIGMDDSLGFGVLSLDDRANPDDPPSNARLDWKGYLAGTVNWYLLKVHVPIQGQGAIEPPEFEHAGKLSAPMKIIVPQPPDSDVPEGGYRLEVLVFSDPNGADTAFNLSLSGYILRREALAAVNPEYPWQPEAG